VSVTQFRNEISSRIAAALRSLDQAREDGDDYLVEVRLGELEGLARLAAEHGLPLDGAEESLARHGLSTPGPGVPLSVDLRASQQREHDGSGSGPIGR
jgi:hypothetical protein